MFKQCAAAFLAASTLLFSACGAPNEKPAATAAENAAFATITDDNGRTVTFAEKPQRVVVTSASYLAPFYAVGGEVVGRRRRRYLLRRQVLQRSAPSIRSTWKRSFRSNLISS